MIILGIDPGPRVCGWALYDASAARVMESDSTSTEDLVRALSGRQLWDIKEGPDLISVEKPTIVTRRNPKTGRPVTPGGSDLVDTAIVVGRITEAAFGEVELLLRQQVLRYLDLLGRPGNRDALVRRRLIEMHEPTGGGKTPQVGTQRDPGPLYGVTGHAWQALGVAVAAWLRSEERRTG